jgi:hypothetical protein
MARKDEARGASTDGKRSDKKGTSEERPSEGSSMGALCIKFTLIIIMTIYKITNLAILTIFIVTRLSFYKVVVITTLYLRERSRSRPFSYMY